MHPGGVATNLDSGLDSKLCKIRVCSHGIEVTWRQEPAQCLDSV